MGNGGGNTYSRASSTGRARGAGLTTHTLGTFRASGSLGTSFALDQKKGHVRSHLRSPTSLLDMRVVEWVKGRDRRQRIRTLKSEKGPQDKGAGERDSLLALWVSLACGSSAQRRAGVSP